MNEKLKLFISYSHKDEYRVTSFINHITPLKTNGIIEEWYDRKILGGENLSEKVDYNLSNSDIVCLIISSNFLSSSSCLKEKNSALELRNSKGIRIIPIILSPCDWMEHKEINDLLVMPTDGKPITKFEDEDEGWLDAVKGIKKVCLDLLSIKTLKTNEVFQNFLTSADILTKSHSQKEKIELSDIFVYPELKKYDETIETKKYYSKDFNKDVLKFGKIIIAGENQSGKTSLCKQLFVIFKNLNYVPVYLSDDNKYLGNPYYKIERAFLDQYCSVSFNDIDKSRIVPIVDNFHFAKHKEKYIEQFQGIKHQVLIVDDIFGLSIRNENLIREYNQFKILEFSPMLRDQLITKWIEIKESDSISLNPNFIYQSIDEKTEIIEQSLGKVFGKGIMPAYPFFILSILAAQETQKPLGQDITSQGYCYQMLIFLFLQKQGVKNEQIDIYINFLTELSFYIYNKNGDDISSDQFDQFITSYKLKFNFPLSIQDVIKTLSAVNICGFDSLNNYNFCYPYIYYFFVAKFLAENIESKKALIDKTLNNLHKDENAYITIFISHHLKSNYLLDELLLNAEILFEEYTPASLDSSELSFFDKHEEKIIKAILPSYQGMPAMERKDVLKQKTEIESHRNNLQEEDKFEKEDDAFRLSRELRRSIKTVEVMGLILKNRSGSLDLERLEYIFEQGMNVHLRILTSFFKIIENEENENDFVEFIKERLNQIIAEKDKTMSIDQIEKIARSSFWNINFIVVHGFVTKIIHSLGSNNLLKIASSVCNKVGTPSSFIVNQGIYMWYAKNLKIDEIVERIENDGFSKTAKKLMHYKIVEYSRLHPVNFKDLKKIEQKLKIPTKLLLTEKLKNK